MRPFARPPPEAVVVPVSDATDTRPTTHTRLYYRVRPATRHVVDRRETLDTRNSRRSRESAARRSSRFSRLNDQISTRTRATSARRETSSDRAPSALRGVSSSHPTTPRASEAGRDRRRYPRQKRSRVARAGSEERREEQISFCFFAAARRASRASARRAERVRRGCVVPATSRDRNGGLHRELRPRKSSGSSASSSRRARAPGLSRQEKKHSVSTRRRSAAFRRRGEKFDPRDRGLFRGNHGEKFPTDQLARRSDSG